MLERYTPVLIAYLSGRTRSVGEMEDLIQEVFLAALAKPGRLRDRDKLGAWLLGIARNKLNTLYRKRKLEYRFREDRGSSQPADRDFFAEVADPARHPDEEAQGEEIAGLVAEAIGRLSDKYRVVVSLCLQQHHSLAETSALLGLKQSTTRMRFRRGLEQVRKSLRDQGLGMDGKGGT